MTGSKIMKKRILIALGLALAMVIGSAELLYAQEGVLMPALDRDSSRLCITAQHTDEDITTPISGMEFTVYKVADVTVEDGKVKYTPTEEFKSANINYDDLTASSSINAAQQLYGLIGTGKVTGKKAVSNAEGKADFGDMKNGMYLVVNSGATGSAMNYTRLAPYILAAPQPMIVDGADAWDYDVISIPKTVNGSFEEPTEGTTKKNVKDETENKQEPSSSAASKQVKGSGVNTGDAIRLILLLLVMVVSAIAIVVVTKRRRAKE